MMTVTQLAPPTNDPPLSAVCAQRACSFCTETSATCGCSNCHHTCTRCLSECRRLYGYASTCRACHEMLTKYLQRPGTACLVCEGTTYPTYVDPRIGPDPICLRDHLRLWLIKTA